LKRFQRLHHVLGVAQCRGREITPIPKGTRIDIATAGVAKVNEPLQALLPVRNSGLVLIPIPDQVWILTGRRADRTMNRVTEYGATSHRLSPRQPIKPDFDFQQIGLGPAGVIQKSGRDTR
jgi:hypothetical protein